MSTHGDFSGEPQTVWLTERGPDRRMRLLEEFWFDDPSGKRWLGPKDYDQMDGASIPRALWSLVGSPYTGDYRRASIVHDYACDQAGNDSTKRLTADRMFFHACMAGGCSWDFATVLYIGVRIGAWMNHVPAWKDGRIADDDTYRLVPDANEQRIQADYRQITQSVLAQGEMEDPAEVERRVVEAFTNTIGRHYLP